jgi:hypothetical protein
MTRHEALRRLATGEKLPPAIRHYYKVTEPRLKKRFTKILPSVIRMLRQIVGSQLNGGSR